MTDAPGPRRRSTHLSSDALEPANDQVDEDLDESTVIAVRRRTPVAAEPEVEAEDLDESTVIASRRRTPVVAESEVEAEDVDESTVIASRRRTPVVAESEVEAEDVDESTVIASRRRTPVVESEVGDVDESTVMSARREARAGGAEQLATDDTDDDLEPTDPGQRRAQHAAHPHAEADGAADSATDEATAISTRRQNTDDATAVSKRKTGLEATIKSLRKPKINPPAKIETLSLATRRTTQILDDGGQPVSRAAFTPEQAILKAPYKPRKQTVIPVVHLDRQFDTRPPKPFAESMTALARQRTAARRRVVTMLLVGGGTMVLSAGGIIALAMLG